MKKSGNNVKSIAEKKAAGTYRPTRDGNRMEVQVNPIDTTPEPPDHFTEDHVKQWAYIWDLLKEDAALTKIDYPALVLYCEAWVMKQEAWDSLQSYGLVIDLNGKPTKNPAHMVYSEAVKTCRMIIEQFGGTLRARQGLKVEKQKETSGLLAHINRSKTKAV